MVSGIYALVNRRNQKRYVGSAVRLNDRKAKHFRNLRSGTHSNLHLQASFNLGDEFDFVVLEVRRAEVLVEREQFYIDKFKTLNKRFGYNLTVAGRTIPSADGRRRIGESKRGRTWEQILGKKQAKAQRQLYRRTFSGSGNPRYGKGGSLHPFSGKTTVQLFGEEVAAKMKQATSKRMRGRKVSVTTRRKISKARAGKLLTEEHRAAIKVGVNKNFQLVGRRTFEEKYGERAASIKAKIAASVSASTKGLKKSPQWVEKMKSRRCPVTGRLLPKEKLNAD